MDDLPTGETFEEFRRSFSYGSRNDLNFKFFKSASDDEAAEFLRTILDELGEAFDTGSLDILVQTVIEAQAQAYAPNPDAPPAVHVYDTGPFAPTAMPVAGSRVGLLTSTGHFVDGDDPEPFGEPEMTQQQAIDRISEFLKDTPKLSVLPSTIDDAELRVRHGGYDITSISRDRNVAFPVDRLAEAANDGRIGGVTDNVFSFPGATAQGRLKKELPGWITRIEEEEPDVLLLVPVWPVCHVSVGHVARFVEEAGIPTVVVMVKAFEHVAERMMLPRTLLTPFPMGRPFGAAGDVDRQAEVLDTALELLDRTAEPGTIQEFDKPFRTGSLTL